MPSCAYCTEKPAVHRDHLITKNQARRRPLAAVARNDPKYIVRSCADCNWIKGLRLFVPESHAHLIPELEALTMGRYRVWTGDAETLRVVVK